MNISSSSNSSLRPESLLINVSKTVCRIVLVLFWFSIIGKIVKTPGFPSNTHLLDLSNLDMSSRGVHLYHLWQRFSICKLNQVKRENIPINVWHFALRGYSDNSVHLLSLRIFLREGEVGVMFFASLWRNV